MQKEEKKNEDQIPGSDKKLDQTENDILEIKTIDILGFISFLKGKKLLERPDIYA